MGVWGVQKVPNCAKIPVLEAKMTVLGYKMGVFGGPDLYFPAKMPKIAFFLVQDDILLIKPHKMAKMAKCD